MTDAHQGLSAPTAWLTPSVFHSILNGTERKRTNLADWQLVYFGGVLYEAPIEVYDKIYYRYSDPDYSITNLPLTMDDCLLLKEAIGLLNNSADTDREKTIQVLGAVKDRLTSLLNYL